MRANITNFDDIDNGVFEFSRTVDTGPDEAAAEITYEIDVCWLVQRNLETGFVRPVLMGADGRWGWRDGAPGSTTWKAYDDTIQGRIQAAQAALGERVKNGEDPIEIVDSRHANPDVCRAGAHSMPFWETKDKNQQFVGAKKVLFELDRDTNRQEFGACERHFLESLGNRSRNGKDLRNAKVVRIERVENWALHDKFVIYVKALEKKLHGPVGLCTDGLFNRGAMVLRLYHGCKNPNSGKTDEAATAVVDGITRDGWKPTYGQTQAYGRGSYFARDASYSHDYASSPAGPDLKQMLVAEVAVGPYQQGSHGKAIFDNLCMTNPNVKQELKLCHTAFVDNQHDPAIFVVADPAQAYPAYVITYRIPRTN